MLETAKSIYVSGIGGIGVSALARILKSEGKQISGSDLETSEITSDLEKLGVKVMIPQKAENITLAYDLLIYSTAVPDDNPERKQARKLNIPELSYPEALGELAKSYEKVIAIAGTNGKTTTTAMIGRILEEAYEDPTVVVGGKVLAWNSNARVGSKKYLVLEADEYRRAFLNYRADVAVITNIEADHLDYYKGIEDIKSAFSELLKNAKPGAAVIYNADDKATAQVVGESRGLTKIGFGFSSAADINPQSMPNLHLLIPGRFTLANALAAAAATHHLGISWLNIRKGLENFTGTWRRFEKAGMIGKTDIISDYAHHPTGLKVFLETAFDVYAGKSILLVFQPHQRNRTKNLFKDFVKSMCESGVNDFILPEIFDVPGREAEKDQDVSSKDLVRELRACGKHSEYAADLKEAEAMIREGLSAYDVILIVGAGDVYKIANNLVRK